MPDAFIHDQGRGPEIVGTRITVYNLLPHFLDETTTEAYLCRLYELTPEQVAAARAYILNNPAPVLSRHLEIEARIAVGNPPKVIVQAQRTHRTFLRFKEWLADRERQCDKKNKAIAEHGNAETPGVFPAFRDWLDQRDAGAGTAM